MANDPQSLHKYLYAGGDPVNRIDPSGRMDGTTAGRMPGAGSEYAMIVLNVSLATTASLAAVACAVNVDYAYDALKVYGAAMYQVDLPVKPDLLHCGAKSDCIPYEQEIEHWMGVVREKEQNMLLDACNLYPWRNKNGGYGKGVNPDYPDVGTWVGHKWWFVHKAQDGLQNAIDEAIDHGCPVSDEAERLATMLPPVCPNPK
jgi:hypothetical protein